MRSGNRRRRAFTLIEVLLVIVILGMLAGVVVVTMSGTQEGAKVDTTKIKIDKVINKLKEYNLHVNEYPTEEQGGLQALLTKPAFDEEKKGEKWRGPYVRPEDLKDGWNNDLKYELADEEAGDTTRKAPPRLVVRDQRRGRERRRR